MLVATFVLVHGGYPRGDTINGTLRDYGANNGGHVFKRLDRSLSAYGHIVYRPTLTGFGSRIHHAGPDLTFDTLFRDVSGLIEAENLHKVVLLGFSFGGFVVSGAANLVTDRIAQLVYFDAFVPDDGETMADVAPEAVEMLKEQRFLLDLLYDRIPVSEAVSKLPHSYVYCSERKSGGWRGGLDRSAKRARDRGWQFYEIVSSHHHGWLSQGLERYPDNPVAHNDAVDILLRIAEQV
jgi:pimeloyl-ACP methyl ester carboxylesterase